MTARRLPAGPGPWDDEPDELAWRFADLECRLVRGPFYAWCGYVGLPAGHPWRGVDTMMLVSAPVHGGITYQGGKLEPAWPDGLEWVGFDCSHSGDLTPSIDAALAKIGAKTYGAGGTVYRTLEYAKNETESLAAAAEAVWKIPT